MQFTLNLSFDQRYDYTITARPCTQTTAVGFVYNKALELRATGYDSLHAILDFYIKEIVDDVCHHLLQDSRGLAVPVITATISRDDKVLFQTCFQNGNLDSIVKQYMLPMWY
jgi:hypothetical protein